MSTAIDDACRELRALLGEYDLEVRLTVRRDGRVRILVDGHAIGRVYADLEPGSAHPLPSVALARMVRP